MTAVVLFVLATTGVQGTFVADGGQWHFEAIDAGSASANIERTNAGAAASSGDAVFRPASCTYLVRTSSGQQRSFKESATPADPKHAVCVPDKPIVLTVTPSRLPPSRLRFSAESARGEHATAEWDPLVTARLARKIVLPAGLWSLSFRSDAIRDPSHFESDYSWQEGAGLDAGADSGVTLGRGLFQSEAAQAGDAPRFSAEYYLGTDNTKSSAPVVVTMSIERLPSITRSLDVLTTREGGSFGGQSASSGGRGFGLDGAAINDAAAQLAAVLAEVIVDRAKTRALQNAKSVILDELGCGEAADGGTQALTASPDGGDDPTGERWLRLPRVCGVLKATSLDSLAAGLDSLQRAAEADLLESFGRWFASQKDAEWADVSERFRRIYRVATEEITVQIADAIERGSIDSQAGQATMSLVAHSVRDAWLPDPSHEDSRYPLQRENLDKDELAAAAIGVVFAAASQCFTIDGCDARQLADMLAHPDHYFYFGDAPPELVATLVAYIEAWPDALRTAQSIVTVMRNGPGLKPEQALSYTVDVATELEIVRRCLRPVGTEFPKPNRFGACMRDDPGAASVRTLRRALDAAIARDGTTALSSLMQLAEQKEAAETDKAEKTRLDQIIGSRFWRAAAAGIGAWNGASATTVEAKRAASKAAINAAVDVLTDHHERVGWVVSISGALRAAVGQQWGPMAGSYTAENKLFGGPSIPVGISFERPRLCKELDWVGIHADLSIFDLGRLIQAGAVTTDNKIDATKLVWPQISLGFLFAGGWVFVGGVVAFQPTTQEWSLGGSIGLQVPLLDFN